MKPRKVKMADEDGSPLKPMDSRIDQDDPSPVQSLVMLAQSQHQQDAAKDEEDDGTIKVDDPKALEVSLRHLPLDLRVPAATVLS